MLDLTFNVSQGLFFSQYGFLHFLAKKWHHNNYIMILAIVHWLMHSSNKCKIPGSSQRGDKKPSQGCIRKGIITTLNSDSVRRI